MLVLKETIDSELARRRWKELPIEGDRYAKGLRGRRKEMDSSYLQTDHQRSHESRAPF